MEEKKCYLESKIKSNCTGCGACLAACPKKCIKMEMDEEYFCYPVIDKKNCINCKKCIRSCPVVNDVPVYNTLELEQVYGYKTKNEDELLSASSGGAFADIVKSFCEDKQEVAIFGVKFDDNLKVVHDYVTSIKEIGVFKKSKYVQSDIRNSYSKVQEFLTKGYYVVFSGTPCQVAGLRKYLNKDYDKLLCIDIVCHGVPSQGIFDMAMSIEAQRYKSKITKINFREKVLDRYNKYKSKNIRMIFEDGTQSIKDSYQCMYLKGFQTSLYYRPSCYNCKFASVIRYSDITIADCWGIENINSSIDFHKGYSCVVIHTNIGKKAFENISSCDLEKLNLDFIVKNNNQYSKPATYNKNREKFYNNLTEANFEKKVKKYTKLRFINRAVNKIKKGLSKIVKGK